MAPGATASVFGVIKFNFTAGCPPQCSLETFLSLPSPVLISAFIPNCALVNNSFNGRALSQTIKSGGSNLERERLKSEPLWFVLILILIVHQNKFPQSACFLQSHSPSSLNRRRTKSLFCKSQVCLKSLLKPRVKSQVKTGSLESSPKS